MRKIMTCGLVLAFACIIGCGETKPSSSPAPAAPQGPPAPGAKAPPAPTKPKGAE